MERGKPLKRGKGPARARAGRPARDGELSDAEFRTLVIGRVDGWCEARLPGCTGLATQAHHRWLPGRVNTPENGVAVCSSCHTGSPAAIHRDTTAARASGLLLRSWDGPPTERWARDQPGERPSR